MAVYDDRLFPSLELEPIIEPATQALTYDLDRLSAASTRLRLSRRDDRSGSRA